MSRFFIESNNIIDYKIIMDDKDDVSHIQKVLRYSIGDELILCDGRGTDYLCKISEIEKKQITFSIKSSYTNKNEPLVNVTLFQGVPKADKMDYIIQKCTEIGVKDIYPLITKFTVSKIDESKNLERKIERWNKIAREAAKQCNRGVIPLVHAPIVFKDLNQYLKQCDLSVIPYEKSIPGGLKQLFHKHDNVNSVAVIVGPEGGFDKDEVKYALENGAFEISLGNRILRTETAPIVIMSIIMYNYDIM